MIPFPMAGDHQARTSEGATEGQRSAIGRINKDLQTDVIPAVFIYIGLAAPLTLSGADRSAAVPVAGRLL